MNDFIVTITIVIILLIIEYLVFLLVKKSKFDKQIKRIIIVSTSILLVAIFVPIFIDRVIIASSIQSNITNEQWVGFLGNYTGAILGGIITMYALIETLLYNNNMNNITKSEDLDNRKDNGARLQVVDSMTPPSKNDNSEVVEVDIIGRLSDGKSTVYNEYSYIYLSISNIGKYNAENLNITISDHDKEYEFKTKNFSVLKKFSTLKKDEKFVVKIKLVAHPIKGYTNLPWVTFSIAYDDRINSTLTESYSYNGNLKLINQGKSVNVEWVEVKHNR